jgi:hypothetical protein
MSFWTNAHVAGHPHVGTLPDTRLSLEPDPAVRAWRARIVARPGDRPMPGG